MEAQRHSGLVRVAPKNLLIMMLDICRQLAVSRGQTKWKPTESWRICACEICFVNLLNMLTSLLLFREFVLSAFLLFCCGFQYVPGHSSGGNGINKCGLVGPGRIDGDGIIRCARLWAWLSYIGMELKWIMSAKHLLKYWWSSEWLLCHGNSLNGSDCDR